MAGSSPGHILPVWQSGNNISEKRQGSPMGRPVFWSSVQIQRNSGLDRQLAVFSHIAGGRPYSFASPVFTGFAMINMHFYMKPPGLFLFLLYVQNKKKQHHSSHFTNRSLVENRLADVLCAAVFGRAGELGL
jgi:hypothetical protein